MIGIVDYGAGNLFSLQNSLMQVGGKMKIVQYSSDFSGLEAIILPGVGSFGAAMEKLRKNELVQPIQKWINSGKPFLGICLGMQLLMEASEESPNVSGLGVIEGDCQLIEAPKLPHMGWNVVTDVGSPQLFGGQRFYFVHSFAVHLRKPSMVIGYTDYFCRIPVALRFKNILAVQFHPEKSGPVGLNLLRKWVSLC